MAALLEVRGLKAFYGQTQSLYDVGFDIETGGITTLLGANGAGKTTTLRAICNMVRSTGAIEFEGAALSSKSTENIVRLGIAHVHQRGTQRRETALHRHVQGGIRFAGKPLRDACIGPQIVACVVAHEGSDVHVLVPETPGAG